MIWFESHATSVDNEAGVASGHFDAPLSELGERRAVELGARHPDLKIVWCSDLQRAYMTAELAFDSRAIILPDRRLREVNLGDMTRAPAAEIEATRGRYVDSPYPNGESYRDVCDRVQGLLHELSERTTPHLIVGHRATWYALEHLLGHRDMVEVVSAPWCWQPGWRYRAVFS